MTLDTLEAIRTRRVAKYYDQDKAVPEDLLWTVSGSGTLGADRRQYACSPFYLYHR